MSANKSYSSTTSLLTVNSTEPKYDVGYKKPPKEHQFPPGQSGNSNGRPKGTPNLKTAMNKVLGTKVLVRENGCSNNISMIEAMIRRMAEKAINGDTAAFRALILLSQKYSTDEKTLENLSFKEIQKLRPKLDLTITQIEPTKICEYENETAKAEAERKKQK